MSEKKQLSTKKAKPEMNEKDDGSIECRADSRDVFNTAFGTDDEDMSLSLLSQLLGIVPGWNENNSRFHGAMALLEDIAPQNSVESMLAVQMVAAHNMAMKTAERAMIPEQPFEYAAEYMSRSSRMMKVFVSQTEALAKLRGNTKTVTIKHVNVNEGGQAIIGDVHHGGVSDGKK